MGDSFDPHLDAVLGAVEKGDRYVALARRGVANYAAEYRGRDPLGPSRERLKQALGARSVLLFNELVINGNGWIARGPAKRFRSYPLSGGYFLPWTVTKHPPRADEAFAQHLRHELTGDNRGWQQFAENLFIYQEDMQAEAQRIVGRRRGGTEASTASGASGAGGLEQTG